MSYSVSISWQVSNFFMSMGLGFFIGLIYDIILSISTAFSKKKIVYIISDLIFSLLATLMFFSFTLIYCQGETHLISVLACLTGALVFHCTIGKILSKLLNTLASRLKKVLKIIFYPLFAIMKFIVSSLIKTFKKIKLKLKIKEKLKLKEEKPKKQTKKLNNLDKKILNFKKRLEKIKK